MTVLLTGDRRIAEDLVHASLVKLYRAWPRLDTSADPDAYLRRVTSADVVPRSSSAG
jgi:DNA-directed RNA polymerase specialized sigma24 family protein